MTSFLQGTLKRFGVKVGRPHTPPASSKSTNPFALTLEDGFGFFPGGKGTLLGPDQRYKIVRMLGCGQHSSVYLVQDSKASPNQPLLAIKILSAWATIENREGRLHELANLKVSTKIVQTPPFGTPIPRLFDHFEISGPHGDHLCFVVEACSATVSSFRRSTPTRTLRLHVVQLIILRVLYALDRLHAAGLVHTDVQPGNVLITSGVTAVKRDDLVVEEDVQIGDAKYTVLQPQPLPNDWEWNDQRNKAELYEVKLGDLGNAKWEGREYDYRSATPVGVRAPEVILQAGFDSKVDIWAIGCMAFELLTGQWCFHPEATKGISVEEHHLAMMIALTGETFSDAMLSRSQLRPQFFNEQGKLRAEVAPTTLEQAITNYGVMRADDVGPAANFIRACLRLDPEARPTANELLTHRWISGASVCRDYRAAPSLPLKDRDPGIRRVASG